MSSFTSEILELSIAAARSLLSYKTLDKKVKYYDITFQKEIKTYGNTGSFENLSIYISIPPFFRLVVLAFIIVRLFFRRKEI